MGTPRPASSARAATMSDTTRCRPCAEPGAAEVIPVPNPIAHAEPGGTACTTRCPSPIGVSAIRTKPMLSR